VIKKRRVYALARAYDLDRIRGYYPTFDGGIAERCSMLLFPRAEISGFLIQKAELAS